MSACISVLSFSCASYIEWLLIFLFSYIYTQLFYVSASCDPIMYCSLFIDEYVHIKNISKITYYYVFTFILQLGHYIGFYNNGHMEVTLSMNFLF